MAKPRRGIRTCGRCVRGATSHLRRRVPIANRGERPYRAGPLRITAQTFSWAPRRDHRRGPRIPHGRQDLAELVARRVLITTCTGTLRGRGIARSRENARRWASPRRWSPPRPKMLAKPRRINHAIGAAIQHRKETSEIALVDQRSSGPASASRPSRSRAKCFSAAIPVCT